MQPGPRTESRWIDGGFTEEAGMKCQCCSNPATVHLTDIVDGQKKELHLCQACAETEAAHQAAGAEPAGHPADADRPACRPGHRRAGPVDLSRVRHKVYGVPAEGRLGCPHDYEVFRVGLEPLLAAHPSGRPARRQDAAAPASSGRPQAELVELRRQLREAVEAEAYEEAARLRDLLRQEGSHG